MIYSKIKLYQYKSIKGCTFEKARLIWYIPAEASTQARAHYNRSDVSITFPLHRAFRSMTFVSFSRFLP